MSLNNDRGERVTVFIISPTESCFTERGKRHPNLARFLVRRGVDVTYLTSNFNHSRNQIFGDSRPREQMRDGYRILEFRCGGYSRNVSIRRIAFNLKFVIYCYHFLKMNVRASDTLLFVSRPTELFFMCALLQRRTNCRVICDVRDVWPDAFKGANYLIYFPLALYCKAFLWLGRNLRASYVYVSHSYLEWAKKYFRVESALFAPLGFDKERWKTDEGERQWAESELRCLVAGKLSYQIDPSSFLYGVERCERAVKVSMVGESGTGERVAHIQKLLRSSKKLEKCVKDFGMVKPELMEDHYRHAHLCVVTMVSFGLPNKVFDAIASHTPMLVIGNEDLKKFVEDNGFGWGIENNADRICSFLESVRMNDLADVSFRIKQRAENYAQDTVFERIYQEEIRGRV